MILKMCQLLVKWYWVILFGTVLIALGLFAHEAHEAGLHWQKVHDDAIAEATSEGRSARLTGLSDNSNPYQGAAHHVEQSRAWFNGYVKAAVDEVAK